ncbi:MAG: hypothetical protein MJ073_03620 [Oscillibacter sp.]|nr:hypothetical protein [Oscillibacter sp.]
MKQKMWIAVLGITLSLTACGTKAPADQPEIPIQQTEQTEVPTDPSTEVPAVPEAYLEIIAQYQVAIKEQYDRIRMEEKNLNAMASVIAQEEDATVGYEITDLNGDNVNELLIGVNGSSDFYGSMILDLYTQEAGTAVRLFQSAERNRWYHCDGGAALNIGSSSAMESFYYLCTADRELAFIDAVEYDSVTYPDDPWFAFTGETWEHIDEDTARQKMQELESLITPMELTKFS